MFRKKHDQLEEQPCISNITSRGKGKIRASADTKKSTKEKKKTVCRSSSKKSRSTTSTDKRPKTLESCRKERYGIGKISAKIDPKRYGRGKQCSGQVVDYCKLNEGDEGDVQTEPRATTPKRFKHTTTRSGPTPHRQIAQRQSTESPKVTTLSTVKSKKQTTESKHANSTSTQSLIGIPAATNEPTDGVTPTGSCTQSCITTTNTDNTTSTTVIKDAFLGVPETDDLLLPDLMVNNEFTNEDQHDPLESTQDIPGTEDKQNAVDALLSLSTPSFVIEPDDEDNSLLVPIGGPAICEDVALTVSRLGQLELDSKIARMMAIEEHRRLEKSNDQEQTTNLIDVPSQKQEHEQPLDSEQPVSTGIQTDPPIVDPPIPTTADGKTQEQTRIEITAGKTGAVPKTGNTQQMLGGAGKKGTRGAFKSQLYGLRRKHPKDRAYKCQVCGTSKRSMESLNDHHRRNHNPQMCGVCGKMFDLATMLAHHMYSHYTRKHHCDKCGFHCFFKSELESHKIVHRERPTHQCMKCGRWFKRKGELSLHVQTHKKTWYDCDKCDFSTKLLKYLKEHEKSHVKKNEKLPYACDICGKWFLWCSGVNRHKEKTHSG